MRDEISRRASTCAVKLDRHCGAPCRVILNTVPIGCGRPCSDTSTLTTRAPGWRMSRRASLATTCFGAGMAAHAIPLSQGGHAAHAAVGEHTAPARRRTSATTRPVAPVLRGAAWTSAHNRVVSLTPSTPGRAPRAIPHTCLPSGNAAGRLMCRPYRPCRPCRRVFRARLSTRRRPRRRPRHRALRPRPPNPRRRRLSPLCRR